ncbi:MFS transporter [Nonomuraea cavernae]|uniref:MFS transporter n=1 Tax=Nonomuraea cavernae TaxID=2045107 RepID=A0A917YND4_9ACTN|nr:MFS transporter [Nonomuraea cavernae]MCA2183755.1 MFS transporter [Nonomuraea cavernae]GGO61267.1 MFS transporter [Nonomuraea cavernae]
MSLIKGFQTGSDHPDRELSPAALVRLRVAVTLFFALAGFLFAGWAVRIPAIKEQIGASPGPLGLAMLCMTGAAVLTMLATGALCRRFGSRRVTIATAALLCVSVVPPTLTDSAVGLGLVLIIFGVAYGGIDVAVNSVAVDLIAALGRPVMPGFHAANSFGSLGGAALGGLLAPYLSPTQHMLLMVPAGLLATVILGRMLMAYPLPSADAKDGQAGPASTQDGAPATGAPEGVSAGHGGGPEAERTKDTTVPAGTGRRRIGVAVVVFGLIGLCAAFSQGALDGWMPLHIREDLAGSPGAAAAGYAALQLTMGFMRLSGVRLLERLGPTLVVVAGGLIACAGTLLAAMTQSLPLVFVGIVATGIGLANIFPVAMAQAGVAGGPSGIALAATLGYCGILAAPPAIGLLSDAFGLPVGLTLIALAAAVASVIAYVIRPRNASRATA